MEGSAGGSRGALVPRTAQAQSSAANNTCGLLLGLRGTGAARPAVSPRLSRTLSPSPFPERSGGDQDELLGRKKKCERSHDSFLSARLPRSAALGLLLSRSRARRASRAPCVSFSAAPTSALSSHYPRATGGQEVIRNGPVAASTRQARDAGAGGARARGGAQDEGAWLRAACAPQTRGRG